MEFIYGGCGATRNIFRNKKECKDECFIKYNVEDYAHAATQIDQTDQGATISTTNKMSTTTPTTRTTRNTTRTATTSGIWLSGYNRGGSMQGEQGFSK